MITVLLLNYRRRENLLQILEVLKNQTVPCEIFLWNNAEEEFKDERVDWVVNSSKNAVCWPRWFMAQYAKNDFVMTLDDDLNFASDDCLEILLDAAKTNYIPGRITGLYGIQVNNPGDYFTTKKDKFLGNVGLKKINKSIGLPEKDTMVDMVKGRCMVVHKNDIQLLPLVAEYCYNCDDIVVSAYLAQGKKRHHLIPKGLTGKLINLDGMKGDMALSASQEWKDRRSDALNHYFGTPGPFGH